MARKQRRWRGGQGPGEGDTRACVAQMTGFPARLQRPIIIFWARKTFSAGISMPRSPRATMMPSLASRISSNLTLKEGAEGKLSYKTLSCFPTPVEMRC